MVATGYTRMLVSSGWDDTNCANGAEVREEKMQTTFHLSMMDDGDLEIGVQYVRMTEVWMECPR